MALSKVITITGSSFVRGQDGDVEMGQAQHSFDGYIKVESLSGNKDYQSARVVFKDKEKIIFMKSYGFKPSLDGVNFIAQAYSFLKTLPEFSGAQDC
jgi:hypothetical protein